MTAHRKVASALTVLSPRARRLTLLLISIIALAAVYPLWTAAPTVVHSPYLQSMREDRVTLMWSTRESMSGVVKYSADRNYSQSATAQLRIFTPADTKLSFTMYQYQAELTGLAPNTRYFYQVLMDGQKITTDDLSFFRTGSSVPFRFLAFGDSGNGSPEQLAIARLMIAEPADLVLHVGDIAYEEGTFEQFTANYFGYYFTMMRHVPFFPVPGNHEYYTPSATPYLALNAVPTDSVPPQDRGRYYSFNWGNVHFTALDSDLLDAGYSAAQELRWLDNDLASATAPWKIVYFHHLPYPVEHHIDDPVCIAARNLFVPIMERYGVQLVLTGHEHLYLRSKPLHGNTPVDSGLGTLYVTTGGAGGVLHPYCGPNRMGPAPSASVRCVSQPYMETGGSVNNYVAVDVTESQITVHAMGMDGKEFDRATLALPTVASSTAVLNGASFTTDLAPGGLVSIFGDGLATATGTFSGYPLPTNLANSTVTLNGTPLPLFFVSSNQINAQVPVDAGGSGTLRVTTLSGAADVAINLADTAPAVFPAGVRHASGAVVSSAAPALPGETVVVYMTGLGVLTDPIPSGQAAPTTRLLRVASPVEVVIGDTVVDPDFAGLTPGLVGVYQVNVKVPSNLASKTYPLRVTTKGGSSAVQNVQVGSRNP